MEKQPKLCYYTKQVEVKALVEYWLRARDKEHAEELFNDWEHIDETLVEVREVIEEFEVK